MPGRRDFLRKTAILAPTALIIACGSSQSAALPLAAAPAYAPKYFTQDEWSFLYAACGRLIPDDEHGPGAVELGVPEFIDREMEGAFGHAAAWYMQGPFAAGAPEFGYQLPLKPREVYRAGIAALDNHCRRQFNNNTFSGLETAAQDKLLTDLESGALDFEDVSGKAFFGFLLQNTKEGYLADPIHGGNKNMGSWKMIGFPGARADYIDWIDRHGVRYPMPPVSVSGQRG